jgi:TPR repeat protein
MYEMGWGAAKDARRALELYGRAVEAGNKPAQDNFARLSAIVEGKPLPPTPAAAAATQIKPAAAPAGALQQAPPPTVFTPDSETHQE